MLSQVYLCNVTTHHIQTTQPQQCSYNEQPLSLHQALSQPLAPTGICISATGAWVQVDRLCRSASDTQTSVTPDVSTKTFGERSFFLRWPICFERFYHSDSSSSFKAALKMHLSFSQLCQLPPTHPLPILHPVFACVFVHVCVHACVRVRACMRMPVVSVIIKHLTQSELSVTNSLPFEHWRKTVR